MGSEVAVLSLISRIESVAESGGGRITFVSGDDYDPISWAQLHDEARAVAAGLQARGIKPGDHVALLGPTTRQLITTIQAIWLTGAALVTMPLPMRMGALEQFVDQTRNRIRRSDSDIVVVDSELAAFVEPVAGDPPFVGARRSLRRRVADLVGLPTARRRSGHARGAAVHVRFHVGAQGRDAPAPQHLPQPRRRVDRGRPQPRRRRGLVAAAVPRHGPDRAADHPHDAWAPTWSRAPPRTSWPDPCGGCGGSRSAEARRPRARTSPTPSRRGRCADRRGARPLDAAHHPQRRRAGRRRDLPQVPRRRGARSASNPALRSRRSAWPRSASPVRSRPRARD